MNNEFIDNHCENFVGIDYKTENAIPYIKPNEGRKTSD